MLSSSRETKKSDTFLIIRDILTRDCKTETRIYLRVDSFQTGKKPTRLAQLSASRFPTTPKKQSFIFSPGQCRASLPPPLRVWLKLESYNAKTPNMNCSFTGLWTFAEVWQCSQQAGFTCRLLWAVELQLIFATSTEQNGEVLEF